MYKAFIAVSAIFAASVSTQAMAVTTIEVPVTLSGNSGAFAQNVSGAFSYAFIFDTTADGLAGASFTYSFADNRPAITFTNFSLNGETLSVTPSTNTLAFKIENQFAQAGRQTLLIAGNGIGGFGGSVSYRSDTGGGNPNPTVPEPATWAMMALGFGLVGAGLRRRRVRVVAA